MQGDQLRAMEIVKVSNKKTQDLEMDCFRGHESKGGVQTDLSLLAYALVGWGHHFTVTWGGDRDYSK